MKYTKEVIEPLVLSSISVSEVMRKLGVTSITGSNHAYISKTIKKYGIDTSHFLGYAAHCGQKSNNNKRHWKDILIFRENKNKIESTILRRALLESGREYKCECCGNIGRWKNKKLILQIDHKNGIPYDNRPVNLRFICPNCHSQTDNWCYKNTTTARKKKCFTSEPSQDSMS